MINVTQTPFPNDIWGWWAMHNMCERDKAYKFFCGNKFDGFKDSKDGKYKFYFITNNKKEIGRFIIYTSTVDNTNTLLGLIIYPPFQNKGYFNKALDIITKMYNDELQMCTSNKHLMNLLTKKGFIASSVIGNNVDETIDVVLIKNNIFKNKG